MAIPISMTMMILNQKHPKLKDRLPVVAVVRLENSDLSSSEPSSSESGSSRENEMGAASKRSENSSSLLDELDIFTPAVTMSNMPSGKAINDLSFLDSLGSTTLYSKSTIAARPAYVHESRSSTSISSISTDENILSAILESFPAPIDNPRNNSNVAKGIVSPVSVAVSQLPPTVEILSPPKIVLNPDLSSSLSVTLDFRNGVRPTVRRCRGSGQGVRF